MSSLPLLPDLQPAPLETVDDFDAVLKALADPTRIRILNLLAAGELCVCDLVELLRLPQPAVSRHLALLRRAGVVDVSRQARFAHYRIVDDGGAREELVRGVVASFGQAASLRRERRAAERAVDARRRAPC